MRVAELCKFIEAREAVRIARELGKPWPWTKDPILGVYRFCNVRREDDKVTKWLAKEWREPHADDPDLWFAFAVARCATNYIPTMAELGYPVPWKPKRFVSVLHARRDRGEGVYGPAYMIGTQGNAGDKAEFLADKLLTPLWAARKDLRPIAGDYLEVFHKNLLEHYAVGSFTAGQIVADLKYVGPLRDATDWFTWAADGPGSRRGLNRVAERPVDENWPRGAWFAEFTELHAAVNRRLGWKYPLHAQDLQNCLCEFDKYERARLNEGRPKQLYRVEV